MYNAWYIVVLNKGIATYVVPARTGGGLGRKSEDSATPSKVSTPLPPGRVVWGPGLPGNGSPGQVLSRVCSSLIAAQVGRLEELGEASLGRCSGPQHRQGRARLL